MQRFILIPLCCILLTCHVVSATEELQSTITTNISQIKRALQQALHLPPAPVTPFRGGLSAVRSDNNKINNYVHNANANDSTKNGSGSDDGSVEASSSDSNNHNRQEHQQQQPPPSSLQHHSHNTNSNVHTFPTSWTPEDFPDPWTNPLLCGGAATASQFQQLQGEYSLTNKEDIPSSPPPPPPQQQQQQSATTAAVRMKRPLFCDPDQVLDQPTLGTVMMKLREFSQEFASRDYVEGGDFGLEVVDDNDEREEEEQEKLQQEQQQQGEQQQQQQQEQQSDDSDGLNSNEDVHTSNDSDSTPEEVMTNLRRRLRQANNPILTEDINRQLLLPPHTTLSETDTVEVAIALVQKINLPAILQANNYFFYSDQDDMVNDAAQYFARYVHDTWNRRLMQEQKQNEGGNSDTKTNIVLIFISVHDRICYISSGTRIASILPWWRLEHVVQDMKPMLRKGRTGEALEIAIEDMTSLLRAGSPTVKDRMDDFFSRFGVVLAFAFFTFLFATYGEVQDRRKRVILAERRSRMNEGEREKAKALQKEFQTKSCPICLENFVGYCSDIAVDANNSISMKDRKKKEEKNKWVDSHGIPMKGNDNRPIKFLRCGHIFDETCWKAWVDSGHGNAMMCPVCRQDIGRGKRGNRQEQNAAGDASASTNNDNGNSGQQQQQHSLFLRIMEHAHAAAAPATLLRPINTVHTTNYGSTLLRSNRVDYEEGLNDSSATSLYSVETTPLI